MASMPPLMSVLREPTAFKAKNQAGSPLPAPPKGTFETVTYPSAGVGNLGAYVSPDPADGKRHPAIIWLTGGPDKFGRRCLVAKRPRQ